jgi:class 3 adenylate cyclase
MPRNDELILDTDSIFDTNFTITNGTSVPTVGDLTFDNVAKDIPVAMLFIDIKGSTHIVNAVQRTTAAKMYKSFLKGVTKITLANDGDVRSFNGDGVLAVFAGPGKSNNAVRAAMEMKYFFQQILTPKLERYKRQNRQLQNIKFDFGIGIDLGDILVVKAGIGGENNRDLVWVGSATNHAVKLAEQSNGNNHIHISSAVYNEITANNLLYVTAQALSGLLPPIRTLIWQTTLPLISSGHFGIVYTTSYHMPIT